ncbi:DUF3718 domain-containing protein [Pseudoalteromonas tunicata]|uniref:DUF3718 domain-containing protein n=1 Tax=Pseudoalteromonas tunicata TaxID=314281 RepID=UPI00273EEA4A|nr:DUF3718 domain-containing protein [Pseudoalteromonas tunicata]MDP4982258.1 DUF3718 domain-containing protein [Pseudoalteromonas tunicata]
MKKSLLVVAACSFLVSLNAQAAADRFIAANNSKETRICMATASNRPIALIVALKEQSMSRKSANQYIRCNDIPLAVFARVYELDKTGHYLKYENVSSTYIKDITMTAGDSVVIAGSR